MAKLFFRKVGDTTVNRKQVDVLAGVAHTEFLEPDATYSLSLRHTGLWADEGVRNQDDFLYLNPSPVNMLDRIQQANLPNTDGNVDLIWNKYKNRAALKYWRQMQAVIAENKANGLKINYDTVEEVITPDDITLINAGGILLPDNRILLIPNSKTQFGIFDPINRTSEVFGSLSTLANKFYGGCLLSNDKVFCTASNGPDCYIVDPVAQTYEPLNANFSISPGKFGGSILLPDGRTISIPRSVSDSCLIDPIDKTIEFFAPLGNVGLNKYGNGVLLPNGKICCVPNSSSPAGLIDPIAKTFTTFVDTITATNVYFGAVLLADETVFCVPYNASRAAIIDPNTQTRFSIGPTDSAQAKYNGGCLLPDGRVMMAPYNASQTAIIDPETEILTKIGSVDTSQSKHLGIKLLPDGRVVLLPSNKYPKIVSASDGNYGALPDLDTCLSAYVNKL